MAPMMFFLCLAFFSPLLVNGHPVLVSKYNNDTYELYELSCTDISAKPNIRWFRGSGGDHVLTTYRPSQIKFTPEGKDLINRTTVHASRKEHKITIKTAPNEIATNWQCCRYWWFINYPCSNWFLIRGSSNTTEGPILPPTGPERPGSNMKMNGTLTLTSISEDQQVTLTCTIDNDIGDKWIVIWISNNVPVFITFRNTSILSARNVTDTLPSFFNVSDAAYDDEFIHNFEDNLQLINVISDGFKHSVTTHFSTFLKNNKTSSWTCWNPFLYNMSNTVIIGMAKETTTGDKSASTSTHVGVIAGGVGGVVVFVLVVVMVILVFRWRSSKQNKSTNWLTKSLKEKTSVDIMMEDNVLYSGGIDNSHGKNPYEDDEKVVEDNVLYEGSKDIHDLNSYQDDEKVIEDNVLYVGSNGDVMD